VLGEALKLVSDVLGETYAEVLGVTEVLGVIEVLGVTEVLGEALKIPELYDIICAGVAHW
jgi:hypothetical protein